MRLCNAFSFTKGMASTKRNAHLCIPFGHVALSIFLKKLPTWDHISLLVTGSASSAHFIAINHYYYYYYFHFFFLRLT